MSTTRHVVVVVTVHLQKFHCVPRHYLQSKGLLIISAQFHHWRKRFLMLADNGAGLLIPLGQYRSIVHDVDDQNIGWNNNVHFLKNKNNLL